MKRKGTMSKADKQKAYLDFKHLLDRPPSAKDNRELLKWLGQFLGLYDGD